MKKSLTAHVQSLRHTALQLNQLTDEASKLIAETEDFLNNECSIGLAVEQRLDQKEIPPPAECDHRAGRFSQETTLAFDRWKGRFRVLVRQRVLHEHPGSGIPVTDGALDELHEEDWEVQVVSENIRPWQECPRELKLGTFKCLPDLLEGISGNAIQMKNDAEATVPVVREMLAALRK